MKSTSITSPLYVLLSAALFLFLATPAGAGDTDGVGDLPTLANGAGDDSDGDSSSSSTANAVAVWAEQNGAPVSERGTFVVDDASAPDTGVLTAESAASSDITAADINVPIKLLPIGDGVSVQGAMSVKNDPDLTVVLTAPEESFANVAVLILDSGYDSLTDLFDDPVGAGVMHDVLVLGELASIDLSKLTKFAVSKGDQLPGTHVTLIVITLDGDGQVHATAARASETAGDAIDLLAD